MDGRGWLRLIFNPWVMAGAVVIALVLFTTVIGLAVFTRPGPASVIEGSTAIVNVISAPTSTSTAPAVTVTPAVTPTAALEVPPSPRPGEIAIDEYVQISNTAGDGLRLRTDPGLKSDVRILAAEAEVFQVKDGPREVDGFTWWYLVGPYDASRRGWGVSNYLTIGEKP